MHRSIIIAAFVAVAAAGVAAGFLLARTTDSGVATATGMVEVFIRDNATPAQVETLESKIKAMPGTAGYTYISEEEALRRFRERFGERIISNLSINPLSASYEITTRDAGQAYAVARQFFDDPAVDNDPGTHNGVKWTKGSE